MALQHKPTAPHHSAQDALRVLETVTRHSTGVTDTELARQAGLDRERLTTLLRMLRREGYVEQTTDGTYVTGEALARLGSAHGREGRPCATSSSAPWTGCATRWAPPSTSAGTSTARSASPSTPTARPRPR